MQRFKKLINNRGRQTGGVTVFTAVMVLIVLTLMIFYAARVGLFEQRVSANEVRQKVAFHAAEAAIDQGVEYLLANQELLLSSAVAGFPDGSGGTRNGWLADNKWSACTPALRSDMDHPCGGGSPMPAGSFFYDDTTTGYEVMPIVVPAAMDGVTARLTANVCKVALADPNTCVPLTEDTGRGTYMILTLQAYGYSDCTNPANVTTCQGRATVARPLGNFKTLAGTPTVPLVTRSVFPPNGTALVVPNPNAGGVGVPISAWVNNNDVGFTDPLSGRTCPQDSTTALQSSGTWNTCELQEWYEREAVPAGVACDQPTCSCTEEESLSYRDSGLNTVIGIDISIDNTFPCDLFHTFFKVPDTDYLSVKNATPQQLDDCTTLDETSSGTFWISGDSCTLNSGTVGTPDNPVVIISATNRTFLGGGVEIFGLLYVFDGEDATAEFDGAGTSTVYGALIIDALMDSFGGTVNVVYAEGVLIKAADIGGMGSINGGWRDFGLPEIAW